MRLIGKRSTDQNNLIKKLLRADLRLDGAIEALEKVSGHRRRLNKDEVKPVAQRYHARCGEGK